MEILVKNPVFGMGSGMFGDYEASVAPAGALRALGVLTHNVSTQASSEAGLLALIFAALSGLGIARAGAYRADLPAAVSTAAG